mmetsp:Transcript_33018/g.32155  ORF Transcript_33018/g.32155 Transcript_33018/m.32155 type:complete len:83 (+) Transcript_33018:800-1048(+)
MGETAGPILGSVLQDWYGYRNALDCGAIFMLVMMILYFVFCGSFNIFIPTSDKKALASADANKDIHLNNIKAQEDEEGPNPS